MTGDGTSDAPALAEPPRRGRGYRHHGGQRKRAIWWTSTAIRQKLIEIVGIGQTAADYARFAHHVIDCEDDVAKYFAIIPAMFAVTNPPLNRLNIMGLHTPERYSRGRTIFNPRLIIIALPVPLALRRIQKYRALSGETRLTHFALCWFTGWGGIIAPLPSIWAIDRMLGLPAL